MLNHYQKINMNWKYTIAVLFVFVTNLLQAQVVPSVSISSSVPSNTICAGASITFTAVATNVVSPTYQWKNNGQNILNETNSTYTSTALIHNDVISVEVTNAGTPTVSNNITLTVNALPNLIGGYVSTNGLIFYVDAANINSYSGTGTAWNDLSGNAYHSTLSTVTYNNANGGNLQFNGSATSQTNAGISTLLTDGYTLVQAIKLNAYDGGMFSYNGGGSKYLNFYMGGNSKMRWETYSGNAINSTSTIPLNTWVIVTGTFSGVSTDGGSGTAKIYVNGVLDGTGTLASQTSIANTVMNIGTYSGNMNGAVGLTMFYNRQLSLTEIQDNFNNFSSRYGLLPINNGSVATISACSNVNFNYHPMSDIIGTTFSWSRAAVAGISNALATGTDDINEVLVNTTSSPVVVTYVYTLTVNGCTSTKNISVTVNPNNATTLSSAVGTDAQTICKNTALTNISYTTTNASGISNAGVAGANGLPAGVSATYASNTISISGTPTANGTFNYIIPILGCCGSTTAAGTIIVKDIPALSNFSNTTKYYYDANYVLSTPTSNSAAAFTFTSDNTAIATIVGSTVTIQGVGACNITALQASNASYCSASIVATLTISNVNVVTKNGLVTSSSNNYVSRTGEINSNKGLSKTGEIKTTKTPLNVGDSYGGGIIAYILQVGDPGYVAGEIHGLIAATSDQGRYRWVYLSSVTTSATGTAIGSGLSNTTKIITVQGSPSASYAAAKARAYNAGGYNDWYLPSKNELNKLYLNRVLIGGFVSSNYWNSTESNNSSANFQSFSSGSQSITSKSISNYVRAIRAF